MLKLIYWLSFLNRPQLHEHPHGASDNKHIKSPKTCNRQGETKARECDSAGNNKGKSEECSDGIVLGAK